MEAQRGFGVVCLTGVSPRGRSLTVDVGGLNRELVLENDVVFGSVNANLGHYRAAAVVASYCIQRQVSLGLSSAARPARSEYLAMVEFVEAGGLKIAYERVGEGPPLVFVHGAAEDSRIWEPQLAGLADEFTVVAWDEPGAGRSSDLPEGFGLADFADGLAALLNALELGPAHVAGLSWGGTVLLELYRRHPGLVATLIMIDTYAGWKGSLPADEVRARVAGARKMLAAPARNSTPRFPDSSPTSAGEVRAAARRDRRRRPP